MQTSTDTGCTPSGGNGGCTRRVGPDGEVIRSRTLDGRQGQHLRSLLVTVEKPDGTVLQLLADGPDGTRRLPPVDADALVRIALAPGLTLP